eukprot:CAMPEP_0206139092 /NCGR_PEP_ID=MMETSP1473-20131121/4820_1 /ASSEMBLY_ACC=CAM_ASM_001109 /TAXON_ID=1461547 /ORGANISM="Stichococcus sp, Strain RCC1054" /LENGTH=363 /DNA_ID=CAMNT_0053532731 /DNA_START=93 /DNA_END=1184 /DNA_ORIENTATION=-
MYLQGGQSKVDAHGLLSDRQATFRQTCPRAQRRGARSLAEIERNHGLAILCRQGCSGARPVRHMKLSASRGQQQPAALQAELVQSALTAKETAELERQLHAELSSQGITNNNGSSSGSNATRSNASANGAVESEANFQQQHRFAGKRIAVLKASKADAVDVVEQQRSLGEYMELPASQYSVLDAKRIERIDDDTFRCYVGGINFLRFKVEPVLTVSVVVETGGPTVKLLATELEGSRAVRAVNDKFDATMTNMVRWRDCESTGSGTSDSSSDDAGSSALSEVGTNPHSGQLRQITSNTTIQVTLEVPSWLKFISEDAISKTGSKVMQQVLNKMVPRFLAQLAADYKLWADGDDSRKPIGNGQL